MSEGHVESAANALAEALRGVEGIRVYTDPGARVDPPGVVIGPPTLHWEGPCLAPTRATFRISVVVKANDRAMQTLWGLVPAVGAALDNINTPSVAVIRAEPGVYPSGGTDLPAYQITAEVEL